MKKTQEIYMNPACSLSVKTNKTMIIIVGYCYHTSCIWSSKTSPFYNVTCNFLHSKSELYVWCICFITSLCVCVCNSDKLFPCEALLCFFLVLILKNALTLNRKWEKHVLGFRSWYIIVSKFSGMKGSISRQYLGVEYRVL